MKSQIVNLIKSGVVSGFSFLDDGHDTRTVTLLDAFNGERIMGYSYSVRPDDENGNDWLIRNLPENTEGCQFKLFFF